jgi:hypothetical protein
MEQNGKRTEWKSGRGKKESVVIITDCDSWADRALEGLFGNGTICERLDWGNAASIEEPADAMLLDITPPFGPRSRLLRTWATRAWQPVCLCCLAPTFGAADLAVELDSLGYSIVPPTATRNHDWQEVRSRLNLTVERRVSLVPQVARVLACRDLAVIEVLEAAFRILPTRTTVDAWRRELGLSGRQTLASFLAKRDLPPPKELFEWLRLACVVDFAQRSYEKPTRDLLAEKFRYANGDYLGRRAKELTGEPLGTLLAVGLDRVLAIMAERLNPRVYCSRVTHKRPSMSFGPRPFQNRRAVGQY